MPRIELDRTILSDVEKGTTLEWVVTNGLGGYAASTVLGINTRKYHGLLVPSFHPPVDRRVLLSKLDEQLLVEGEVYSLGSNEFSQGLHPEGYKHLVGFSLSPFPTFIYNAGDVRLRKTVFMPHGKNATVILYETLSLPEEAVTLRVHPLVNARHFHAVTDKDKLGWSFVQKPAPQKTTVQTANPQSALIVSSDVGTYSAGERWVENMLFRVDKSLGTSCLDDCYVPGTFELELAAKARFFVLAVADTELERAESLHSSLCSELEDADSLVRRESGRLTELLARFRGQHPNIAYDEWLKWLVLAADSFIVNRFSTKTKSVIAGYHWFEDWGRDSLIALPGLTLVTGRFQEAREILRTFKHYCSLGIVPNRFPDDSGMKPVYNTVDATLWYFNAVLQYLKYTGDFDFVRQELWSMLQSVVDYHIQGTINHIRLDNDGLITHGSQLTWMDAMVHNNPVTPREGKAVEIQALWYNALRIMQLLASCFGQMGLAENYCKMAEKAQHSFAEKFWNPHDSCLFDTVNGEIRDRSVRPNQVFAVSLDFSMLDEARQAAVVSVAQEKLWATYGVRTLSADDSRYRGRYGGGWSDRDTAYHNGTAWPWLIGPFVTGFLRLKNFEEAWRKFAFESFLKPLFSEQLHHAGLGTLSEVFDGNPPHLPGGCVAQAWSVAEPLRAYIEDVLFERPSHEKKVLEGFSVRQAKYEGCHPETEKHSAGRL